MDSDQRGADLRLGVTRHTGPDLHHEDRGFPSAAATTWQVTGQALRTEVLCLHPCRVRGSDQPPSLQAALSCFVLLPQGLALGQALPSTQRTPACPSSAVCLGWESIMFLFSIREHQRPEMEERKG